MSTAIPESFTYALQSRLPPNSFVVTWKEFRPDTAPLNGRYVVQGQGVNTERPRFHLRGAPNEFLLNTNCYLVGSAEAVMSQSAQAPTGRDAIFNANAVVNFYTNYPPITNGDQIDYFSGSRESFNSGALPYLDNQDRTGSHIQNRLRSVLARRNFSNYHESNKFDLRGALGGDKNDTNVMYGSGLFQGTNLRRQDGKKTYFISDSQLNNGGQDPPTNTYELGLSNGQNQRFQIPLGYYSNLINSHSVVPLGLMSSYSVNGYSIELATQADQTLDGWSGFFSSQITYPASFTDAGATTIINWTNQRRSISELRIWAPVVQILDPAVMDSILSLYEKREMVNLGGVQFPLSLRMNSLAYRFSQFPIRSGTSDYHFRIAGTDRSVRGLAWYVVENARANNGLVTNNVPIVLTRLQTKIGNEHIHEVVEDQTTQTDNVSNFLNINMRHSGALWSPLPQYIEGRKYDGQCEDDGTNNSFRRIQLNDVQPLGTGVVCDFDTVYLSKCYGVISFENMDRREGDHQGSYQASGKDLTNVGSIEVDMRFQTAELLQIELENNQSPSPEQGEGLVRYVAPTTAYTIYFSYVYDSVMEISPSGVMDITNAVL